MPALSVSSWSLHRTLGPVYHGLELSDEPRAATLPYGDQGLTLLDAPALAAALDIPNLEICHFHFPRTDADYLATLRERLAAAGVTFTTLLVDAGDITAGDSAAREHDLALIERWIDLAAAAGARRVRVVAGEAAPDDDNAIHHSVAGLRRLAEYGRERGVEVITENWRQLALAPPTLLAILDQLDGAVGLCADFGNYRGPEKYDDLRAILPRAQTIHAKGNFPEAGALDTADFTRCLDLSREARFSGEYVLIFDGPGDEQASLKQLAGIVRPYL